VTVGHLVDLPDHFHGPASGCLPRRSDASASRPRRKDVPSRGWHARTQKRRSSGLPNQRPYTATSR
jgi:hypothetical protein